MSSSSIYLWSAAAGLGAVGAVARLGTGIIIRSVHSDRILGYVPLATLVVNVSGCLIYGWVYSWAQRKGMLQDTLTQAVLVGFLGALTTFSTLSFEALSTAKQHGTFSGTTVFASHILFGVLAMQLGVWLGQK